MAMGRRAIAPPDPSILIQDAAELLAETLDTEASATAELSPDGRSLRLRLVRGETEPAEPRTLVHETSSAGTDSLAGYVLQVAHPVVVVNLIEEKRFVDLFLRKHGIRAAIAAPLKLQDVSFGSLAACSREDRRFDNEDVLFVETIAHLVATTVARRRTELSLAQERRFAAGVLQTVDALVLVLDNQWQIVRINSACEQTTGFSLAEIKDRPIWNVFPVPEEAGMFQRLAKELPPGSSSVEFESYLLTKHSQRRRIAWSYSTVTGADGTPESIFATGIDITQQREAEERARRAEQAAEEARQAMADLLDQVDTLDSFGAPAAEGRPVDAFGRLPLPINVERRKRPRRSYPYQQKIAPMIDGKLPDQDTFIETQCRDISSGGFSFLHPKPPASDTFVVALGIPPKISYLITQVCHVTRQEKDGKPVFLVGCNYVGRAAY